MREYRLTLTPKGDLGLIIPSPTMGEHTVEIPATYEGIRLIKTILLADKHNVGGKIGSEGAPVASEIEKFLRERAPTIKAPSKSLPPTEPVKQKQRRLAPDLMGLELDL